jgi:putative transposase
MQASEVTPLREIKSEIAKLKKLLAESHLHTKALKVGFG